MARCPALLSPSRYECGGSTQWHLYLVTLRISNRIFMGAQTPVILCLDGCIAWGTKTMPQRILVQRLKFCWPGWQIHVDETNKVAHVIRRDRREAVLAVGDKNILLHHGDMTARGSGALIACRVDMSAELAESRIRSDKTSSCNVPWRLCEDGNP